MFEPGSGPILFAFACLLTIVGVAFLVARAMARADAIHLNRMNGPRIDKRMAARIEARQKAFAEAFDQAVRDKAQDYLDRSHAPAPNVPPASTPASTPIVPTPDGDAA